MLGVTEEGRLTGSGGERKRRGTVEESLDVERKRERRRRSEWWMRGNEAEKEKGRELR